MKKALAGFLMVGMLIGLLTSCSAPKEKDEIAQMVDNFYEADYTYERTLTVRGEDGHESKSAWTGGLFNEPYREQIKVSVTEPEKELIWTEMYCEEKASGVTRYIFDGTKWVEQPGGQRSRPYYGYGQELTFTLDREEELDGVSVEVYTSGYTVDCAKERRLKSDERLVATISQEYYIDRAQGTVARIVTDLTDQERKGDIAMKMWLDNCSFEEAETAMKGQLEESQVETFTVLNDTPEINVELPQ